MSKKVVGIFTTGEGHQSIAEAAKNALQKDYKIKIFYEDFPFLNIYVALYQFFPSLSQIPFKAISKNKNIDSSVHKITFLKYRKGIDDFFTKHHPDLLINTYGLFTSSLEKIQDITQVPFINIISDPKTFLSLTISPNAKINLTFNKEADRFCKQYYPKANYQSVGWFVGNRFEEKYDQKQVRKELGLDLNKLTFLIASGSEGTNLIMKILPALVLSPKSVQIIVACGNNKSLFNNIETLNSFLDKSKKHNKLIPLEFTPKMHLYMQAADMVIGKAGPNTLFETVATKTPFFAITHIAGQEDGNLDIIREYNLGYVEENPLKAQKNLKKIIEHPEKLKSFENDISKMKNYNQQAKEKLRKIVANLIQ